MVRLGGAWWGAVRFGLVSLARNFLFGAVRSGQVCSGQAGSGEARHGEVWYGVARHGRVRLGLARWVWLGRVLLR